MDNLLSFRSELESALSHLSPASLKLIYPGWRISDSAAALALVDLSRKAAAASIPCEFVNASQNSGVMGLIDPETIAQPPLRQEEGPPNFFTRIGRILEKLFRTPTTSMRFWENFCWLWPIVSDIPGRCDWMFSIT